MINYDETHIVPTTISIHPIALITEILSFSINNENNITNNGDVYVSATTMWALFFCIIEKYIKYAQIEPKNTVIINQPQTIVGIFL